LNSGDSYSDPRLSGGKTSRYEWTQTEEEVEAYVYLKEGMAISQIVAAVKAVGSVPHVPHTTHVEATFTQTGVVLVLGRYLTVGSPYYYFQGPEQKMFNVVSAQRN